jgi:hypothetical protein
MLKDVQQTTIEVGQQIGIECLNQTRGEKRMIRYRARAVKKDEVFDLGK